VHEAVRQSGVLLARCLEHLLLARQSEVSRLHEVWETVGKALLETPIAARHSAVSETSLDVASGMEKSSGEEEAIMAEETRWEKLARELGRHFPYQLAVAILASLEIAHRQWTEEDTRNYGILARDTLRSIFAE